MGAGEDEADSSRIGAQSLSKKYLYFSLVTGNSPDGSCICRIWWCLVVATEVDSELQQTSRNMTNLSWPTVINWLTALVSFFDSPAH